MVHARPQDAGTHSTSCDSQEMKISSEVWPVHFSRSPEVERGDRRCVTVARWLCTRSGHCTRPWRRCVHCGKHIIATPEYQVLNKTVTVMLTGVYSVWVTHYNKLQLAFTYLRLELSGGGTWKDENFDFLVGDVQQCGLGSTLFPSSITTERDNEPALQLSRASMYISPSPQKLTSVFAASCFMMLIREMMTSRSDMFTISRPL
jgi:hypothetical protein